MDDLWDRLGASLIVAVGREYFDPSTKTRLIPKGPTEFVRNYFFLGRRLLWQAGSVRVLTRAEVAIVELNPRILSVWAIVVLRRLRGRPTIGWGHAWPRSGRHSRSDRLRAPLRHLLDAIIVYTETQRRELQDAMPGKRIIAAPNAIYRHDEMRAMGDASSYGILFAGRLVEAKRPMLLLEAFSHALEKGLGKEYELIYLGDGPERPVLEAVVEESPILRRQVRVEGHVAPQEVADHYRNAFVTASPGYVGLSITQSFSFGIPMLIADDEPHSPEIEAAVDEQNCRFFRARDADSLADSMLAFAREREKWLARSPSIALDCAERYSVERMAGVIGDTIKEYQRAR